MIASSLAVNVPNALPNALLAFGGTPLPTHRPRPALRLEDASGTCEDSQFIALLAAYRRSGGLARATELRPAVAGSAELIRFDWSGWNWLPLFQFCPGGLALRPEVKRILAELPRALDGWGRTQWFASPNAWLRHRRPVDLLDGRADLVAEAARVDCFIAGS
ncbi:MAG TPA: hypothetical protein VLA61_09570 [Ideonella sp.]|uniref:hypothetical protein n=1 Tax=Ideonella sp. TaxID=1929293 RepID=UPI002D1294D2|nr:hypothetical protein [Ideonella sp.]HSI48506.1 hypothetical protein [Ideonella sp.]